MKMLLPRGLHAAAIADAFADHDGLRDLHASTAVPEDITAWLQSLAPLKGVPFGHLVPDDTMLPTESIRFFVVDTNWINALLEGACSLGRVVSSDSSLDEAVLTTTLYQSVKPSACISGFFLRSNVVSGWPTLQIAAYAGDTLIDTPPLRLEQLSPSVLLYMIDGIIDRVELHEPAEGLHFGVDVDEHGGNPYKVLRWVTVPKGTPSDPHPGNEIEKDGKLVSVKVPARRDVPARPGEASAPRTIALAQLATAIGVKLHDEGARAAAYTTAEFALQLVEGKQLVEFKVPRP